MRSKEENNYPVNVSSNTKEIIMAAAKKQFSEQGYLKTTIASIFKNIDIPMGVFTYHYKTKDTLVSEIFARYYKQIEELIEKNFDIPSDKYFLKHALVSRIYHKIILEDNKNSRFYYEVIRYKSTFRLNGTRVIERTRDYLS